MLLTDHVALKRILDTSIARVLSGILLILIIGERLPYQLSILVVLLRLSLPHLRAKRTTSLRHTAMLFLHRTLSRVRKLAHKHSKGSNQRNEVLILGTQYRHLVPFESFLVHFLLLLKLASFARFNVGDEQIAIFEGNLRAGEFGSTSSLTIFETHESHLTVRVEFHIRNDPILLEKLLQFRFRGLRIHISDQQIQVHHRLLELVGLLGDL